MWQVGWYILLNKHASYIIQLPIIEIEEYIYNLRIICTTYTQKIFNKICTLCAMIVWSRYCILFNDLVNIKSIPMLSVNKVYVLIIQLQSIRFYC